MVKIGIVDDDREYAETMAYILREAGYEVTYTDSIEGLVDKLLVNMPDLLIVDIMFPDNPVAGFDAVRAVRACRETSQIPILMLTAVNQEYPMNFKKGDIDPDWMPIQDFDEKPIAKATLLEKVAALIKAEKRSC
ncbi:MAG: response regulator transcription factor [Kiritimatiellia bacterium]